MRARDTENRALTPDGSVSKRLCPCFVICSGYYNPMEKRVAERRAWGRRGTTGQPGTSKTQAGCQGPTPQPQTPPTPGGRLAHRLQRCPGAATLVLSLNTGWREEKGALLQEPLSGGAGAGQNPPWLAHSRPEFRASECHLQLPGCPRPSRWPSVSEDPKGALPSSEAHS